MKLASHKVNPGTRTMKNILIASSEPYLIQPLKFILLAEGHEVSTVNSINELRITLPEGGSHIKTTDLIILDNTLGMESIADFILHIRRTNSRLPFVVLTDNDESMPRTMEMAGIIKVRKPFSKDSITDAIGVLLKIIRTNTLTKTTEGPLSN